MKCHLCQSMKGDEFIDCKFENYIHMLKIAYAIAIE
jgi:hypothetical protein